MHILEVMFFVDVDGTLSDFMRTILVYLLIQWFELTGAGGIIPSWLSDARKEKARIKEEKLKKKLQKKELK